MTAWLEMKTNFSPEQLLDPRIAEADSILKRCVHCGLCTATCPTYLLGGDERDSPRGRIYLMKDMFESGKAASSQVQHHVDRCLSCLSCMTTCPGGVDYMHLVDAARAHITATARRPVKERLVRWLLAAIVPYPSRFRWALKAAPMGRSLTGVMRATGFRQLAAMIESAPRVPLPRAGKFRGPGTAATTARRRARVILLAGCAQQVLRPDINDATIRVLARRGIDVEVVAGAGCCGGVVHHMGNATDGLRLARQNVDAWWKAITREPVDAIIINTSGCGTTVKDYGHMLRLDPTYAERAGKVSALTKDVTEFLSSYDLGAPKRWSSLKVAYHAACSLQHGQKIVDQPKSLLKSAGYTVVDVAEGHICCGSAGVYSILQSELAGALRDRKVGNIEQLRADLVAAGNIGCITHLADGVSIPVTHTVELLDWAYGGPVPRGLEGLSAYMNDVPSPARSSVLTADDYIDPA